MFTLVVGTGYTGRRVLESLPREQAAGLNRSPVDSEHEVLGYDLDSREPLPIELTDDYSVVYTVPPGTGEFGRGAFLDELKPLPRRFVYISTTGVYGNRHGAIVTEMTRPRPDNEMSRHRAAAERLLLEWAAFEGVSLVILRVPGIYGPGRLSLDRIAEAVPVLREEDANPGNRIHVDDLVRCCIAALDEEVPAGIYNVGDGDQRSTTWFMQEIARQAGLPAPPEVTLDEAKKTFSEMRLRFLTESRRVDTTKMREVLGVTPTYADPREGIKASL